MAVLRRNLPQHGPGTSATLVGTVFAHRLFDLIPAGLLVLYVIATARIPHWAVTSLIIVFLVGVALFAIAFVGAYRGELDVPTGAGQVRRLIAMARVGLAVLHAPLAATGAAVFQIIGWLMQLLAVWVAMRAFEIDAPLSAAGVVLLLMNVATIFPLWPGNIGLLQAAVALPLREYGVPYATGFAYGLVLQVVEMSVGVGVGLIFLAREGLSFASLKRMEQEEEESVENVHRDGEEAARSRAPADRRLEAHAGASSASVSIRPWAVSRRVTQARYSSSPRFQRSIASSRVTSPRSSLPTISSSSRCRSSNGRSLTGAPPRRVR